MQRAPAFLFGTAREARDFVAWLDDAFRRDQGRRPRRPPRTGKLQDIQQYSSSRFVYTRFNYTTGDAAGQNMTGKATWAACEWIKRQLRRIEQLLLESQFATDKKHSQMNTLHTRGKRVVAEATIPDALVRGNMRVTPTEQVYRARQIATLGALPGRCQQQRPTPPTASPRSSSRPARTPPTSPSPRPPIVYVELRENDDYYYSITLPSLIVATYGGGTGLPPSANASS